MDYECKIRKQRGRINHLMVHSEAVTNPQGERIAYTTFLDVTKNKQLQIINETLKKQSHIISALSREYTSVWFVSNFLQAKEELDEKGMAYSNAVDLVKTSVGIFLIFAVVMLCICAALTKAELLAARTCAQALGLLQKHSVDTILLPMLDRARKSERTAMFPGCY